ncbi:helix-turn-helix transcriptional regulator [Brevibacillus gelatini]|uniref:helix-turn-helix domain-containing protein n=1 Tax=Brevibacillus gelatini TaxID=1655277 RepID=UPI003D812B58
MIGDLVKEYRNRANLTLTELSEKTTLSHATISKIENNGIQRPNPRHLLTLAEALGIPFDQMIGGCIHYVRNLEMLHFLLDKAITHKHHRSIQKISEKILACTRLDTFQTLDGLYQYAGLVEDEKIQVLLYDTILKYAREHGIPVYLARALFQKYLIKRKDLARREHSYNEGKELLHYLHYLHENDQVIALYRLGLQAFSLKLYGECIEHCRKGLSKNQEASELQAAATLATCNSYLFLEDYILANVFLKEYEKFDYPYVQENAEYLRAILYSKTEDYRKAIPLFEKCLERSKPNARIPIANDLLNIFLKMEDLHAAQTIFHQESSILPAEIETPYIFDQVGLYYSLKGKFMIEQGILDAGIECLQKSIQYYGEIGAYREIIENTSLLIRSHLVFGKMLNLEVLQELEKLYNVIVRKK